MIDTQVSERITKQAVVMKRLHAEPAERLSRENMFWYVVKCKPHQEWVAELHLKRAGIITFYPQIKEPKIVRRRW